MPLPTAPKEARASNLFLRPYVAADSTTLDIDDTAADHGGDEWRKQYARFVQRTLQDPAAFASPAILAETIVARARVQLQAPAPRAAAALWALQQLSAGPQASVLRAISNDIMPGLFAEFSPAALTASVPPAYRALAGPAAGPDVLANPFFTHAFHFEVANAAASANGVVDAQLSRLASIGSAKRRAAMRILDTSDAMRLRLHFTAWRSEFRRQRLERWTAALQHKRSGRVERRRILTLTFLSWRWVVESTRSSFAQERLHHTAFQLENARGQFLMQCHRSDRYLHTVEGLRADLLDMRENRDVFRAEARELERALREHRTEARDQQNEIACRLLRVLSECRHVLTRAVERRKVPDELMRLVEPSRAAGKAPRARTMSQTFDEALDEDSKGNANAERLGLDWVNTILAASSVAQRTSVANFSDDFASGEVILLVLHDVYPDQVPLTPLQDANITRRLDAITDIAAACGVAHFPRVSDFVERVSDIVFLAVAELFATKLHSTLEAFSPLQDPPRCMIRYDASMVATAIQDMQAATSRLLDTEEEIADDMSKVEAAVRDMTRYAAFLTRERLAGHPVQLVDQREVVRFCRLRPGRLRDLEFKYNGAPVEWSEQMTRLKGIIRKAFPLLKRIFDNYAGSGSGSGSVTEPSFWRFVSDNNIMDRLTPRHTIERIFAAANRDDDAAVADAGSGSEEAEDEDNPLTELIPSEFTECVIRIADQKGSQRSIDERVDAFIGTTLKAFGSKQGEMNRFRRDVYEKAAQAVLSKYQRDLLKVFQHYAKVASAKVTAPAGTKTKTNLRIITIQDVASIIRDGGGFQGSADEATMGIIAKNVIGDDHAEVPFHDFIECLAALAAFRIPNPFIPLDRKLDVVLSLLLGNLRLKLRGLVSIADVKPVLLQQQR